MTDWRMRLRDADRALESDVGPETAQRLRRQVLASAVAPAPDVRSWSRTFAALAAALTLACAGLLTALQGGSAGTAGDEPTFESTKSGIKSTDAETAPERQQLHFSTPGGTRIIWVFDSGFEVKGTLP